MNKKANEIIMDSNEFKDKYDFQAKMGNQGWRIDHLYWIKDRDGNKIRFKMNAVQRDFYEKMHSRNIILKARQLGFSTFIKIYELDCMLFNNYVSCGTTADSLDNAKKLLKKVEFAYESMDEGLKSVIAGLKSNSAQSMSWENGSSIDVGVSMRSDTKQIVHISELGKISARTPEKGLEIKSGTLNAVSPDGVVFIESTAEGVGGMFYDMVQEAKKNEKPGKMEFKLFFYPWWKEEKYRVDGDINLSERLCRYFERLKTEHGIKLSKGQMNWYALKEREQGDAMKKEFPSYVDEAFEQSTDGVVYQKQLQSAYNFERIGGFNLRLDLPVYTVWDLGYGDNTAIISFQVVNKRPRVLWYDEACHEMLGYYVNILQERRARWGFTYKDFYLPHDGNHGSLTGRVCDELRNFGYLVTVMKRDEDLIGAIDECKKLFHIVDFNEDTCGELLKHLGAYRYMWNEKLGIWKKEPRHDEHSHAADCFRYLLKAVDNYIISTEEMEYDQPVYYENRNSVTGY